MKELKKITRLFKSIVADRVATQIKQETNMIYKESYLALWIKLTS
ncbi:hypothetical protein J2W91_004779 [Paenibacillus amylolyticus]|uniref:Uncharacterized protein n=1 Tax=Paenibacillus amylolyticus TaxID=1451 RepID=A0AAP5H7N2_PAEAM|nr:hypothetical protein [Paenibacillus amylolyticus]MDR6726268.1 hypothetical protein [Paenibacillus amylolyticus]